MIGNRGCLGKEDTNGGDGADERVRCAILLGLAGTGVNGRPRGFGISSEASAALNDPKTH